MELNYTVDASANGLSVKEFLYKNGLSVTLLKKAKIGGITVSGETVTVRKILSEGDTIRLVIPERSENSIEPIDIPLNIAYEDEYVMVIDKPMNMPTHPSKGNSLPTLANAVIARMGKDFIFRAVNRLDRDTSGLVLIAKDAHSASKLAAAMKKKEFEKKYVALVDGIVKDNHAIINAPIEREDKDSIKRTVREDGKEAITEYTVLERREDSTLLEVTIHTGRTHQIRVHLSYVGHPLKGDFLYGKRDEGGYLLRCYKLSFPHPATGKKITVKI